MLTHSFVRKAFVLAAIGLFAVVPNQVACHAGGMAIVYDLAADGVGSFVEEFPRIGPGYQYPIVGNIRITLDPVRPFLENVNSDILPLPSVPGGPAPYSSIVWNQPELFFVGEYLSDTLSADVSMRFFLSPIVATLSPFAPLPPYELFVDLTEGRSKLDLTGGYVGIALGSDGAPGAPNSVSFSVTGSAIPEPTSAMLLLVGATGVIASRRRR